MGARTWLSCALFGAWALAPGCTNTNDVAGRIGVEDPPSFTGGDAAVAEPEAGLLSYCPSSACPSPFTTCPGSQFLCDVNLTNDPANCGSCGFACPDSHVLGGKFQCVGGKCVLECTTDTADCDGIVDNGCETQIGRNENCAACGDVCADPAKPCVTDSVKRTSKCGCDAGLTYCSNAFPNYCVDIEGDDKNCGGCKIACPAGGDGGPRPPHSHYGCASRECGHLKCDAGWADCDGDLAVPGGNGCEASLTDDATCGSCKVACDPDQSCALDVVTSTYHCVCAPHEKNCGSASSPLCKDITSDPFNCGGCGIWCGLYYFQAGFALSHYVPSCTSGSCSFGCEQGWADCNGRLEDGCETNIASDPGNCGACDVVCDAALNQACVAGRCALEPCADGGLSR